MSEVVFCYSKITERTEWPDSRVVKYEIALNATDHG